MYYCCIAVYLVDIIVDARRGKNEKRHYDHTRPEPEPKPQLECYGMTSAWMLWLAKALG